MTPQRSRAPPTFCIPFSTIKPFLPPELLPHHNTLPCTSTLFPSLHHSLHTAVHYTTPFSLHCSLLTAPLPFSLHCSLLITPPPPLHHNTAPPFPLLSPLLTFSFQWQLLFLADLALHLQEDPLEDLLLAPLPGLFCPWVPPYVPVAAGWHWRTVTVSKRVPGGPGANTAGNMAGTRLAPMLPGRGPPLRIWNLAVDLGGRLRRGFWRPGRHLRWQILEGRSRIRWPSRRMR